MRLSICIPTYNRGGYLGELLESIAAQAGHGCEVEVVVSDNASTDDTAAVVEHYRDRFDLFTFHRAETNQGADRNFLKVVELATGDYCWLMGSDDVVEPGGVAAVERALAAFPGAAGAYLRRNTYDIDMRRRLPQLISDEVAATDALLEGADRIFSELGEFIGYLSADVVDRRLWTEVAGRYPLEPFFNAWVHVYVMGRMMQLRPSWIYVAEPCVGYRTGNDSFLAEGLYRRLEIDVAGYEQITRALFGADSPVYRRVMLKIMRHAQFKIVQAKVNGAPPSFFRKARVLMVGTYRRYPRFWVEGYPLLVIPAGAYRSIRSVYNRVVKPRLLAKANG